MIVLKIILIVIFSLIFYQDFKERQVYWFLFPFFGLCSAILFYNSTLPELFYVSVGMNLVFVSILLLIVFLYSKLKLKSKFNEVFGLGDVLLFIALIFSFSTISFLIVFVFSLLFSLLIHFILKQYSKYQSVPLAGYMSLFFALIYISNWIGITSSLYTI
ncbi:hypothetical protein [uncultured Psychroserpens sp.]|uniref:hypothetical protein n=1 Tax=uncultured Psychroserpens sp. TaxID=255436 RepID=UPI002623E670|nr:hypothetical protein [uncultured Psychroserpens sp.]